MPIFVAKYNNNNELTAVDISTENVLANNSVKTKLKLHAADTADTVVMYL